MDDHTINPAFSVRAPDGNRGSPSNPPKKRAPQPSELFCPREGPALYSSLSISFHFICSMELFTLPSESLSRPYLFSHLWALVQTLADLYLNVFSTLSGSHYSRAGGSPLSISFQNFFFFFLHLRGSSTILQR